MPAATETVSPSLVASIPCWMVANGFSSEPSPFWSEPSVETCQTELSTTTSHPTSKAPIFTPFSPAPTHGEFSANV